MFEVLYLFLFLIFLLLFSFSNVFYLELYSCSKDKSIKAMDMNTGCVLHDKQNAHEFVTFLCLCSLYVHKRNNFIIVNFLKPQSP